jgi:hypothetical protein
VFWSTVHIPVVAIAQRHIRIMNPHPAVVEICRYVHLDGEHYSISSREEKLRLLREGGGELGRCAEWQDCSFMTRLYS